MFTKLRNLFPANRVAALAAVLTGIGTIVVTFVTDGALVGTPTGDAITKAAGLLAGAGAVLLSVNKFLDGSQQWDALMHAAGPDLSDAVNAASDGDSSVSVIPGSGLDVEPMSRDDDAPVA